ncbi:MAG: hypothetical protein LBF15_00260 [Candidatus Peribacteria bacterium]|nr:hypothetical protein [Candidatus Peribacteria bacterium]
MIKIVNQNRALRKERDLIEFIKSEPNPLKTKYGRLADNVANALDDESNKLSTYLEILIKQYDG